MLNLLVWTGIKLTHHSLFCLTMEGTISSSLSKGCSAILDPTLMVLTPCPEERHLVQVSAFSISSKSFLREAMYVFPNLDLTNLVVISTMQRALVDLVKVGDAVENEKDRLILVVRWNVNDLLYIKAHNEEKSFTYIRCLFFQFFSLAKSLCNTLQQAGFWADYIDPCSGLPVSTKVLHFSQPFMKLCNQLDKYLSRQ